MTMRRQLIAGNWKMNTTRRSAQQLATAVVAGLLDGHEALDVLVAPPFPYLVAVRETLNGSPVALAAQNVHPEPPGAFTGEVAVDMLRDVGCTHVILGHSERRHSLGETDEFINRKVKAALAGGLDVILCVGELLSERESGKTESVLDGQLEGSLADVAAADMPRVVIAYEPVWAIGTGVTATPEQAQAAHRHLRKRLADRYNPETANACRILYGGSVKPDNADSLLTCADIDGALIGGASLKADSFLTIVAAGIRASS
jgi:triosephosphate isomerase (TIM)